MKIAISRSSGGFSLSACAIARMAELNGSDVFFYKQVKYEHSEGKNLYVRIPYESAKEMDSYSWYAVPKNLGEETTEMDWDHVYNFDNKDRSDKCLVQTVEELGDIANGTFSKIEIVEIPDDVEWQIESCETGREYIAEKHRVWR